MRPMVFHTQKSRVTSICVQCKSDLPRGVSIVRQGALCFHRECFEEHLTEQMMRYKQALAQLRREHE